MGHGGREVPGSQRVRVESAQLHCGAVVTSASVLREPVAAAVCDSVRVLGELPPPRRDSNLRSCPVPRRCPRGGSYSIYKHIGPGGAGDLGAGACVSVPSASRSQLISVAWLKSVSEPPLTWQVRCQASYHWAMPVTIYVP